MPSKSKGETKGASGLAGRYGAALYELAEESNKLDQVAADLRSLQAMIDESQELRLLVASPVFSRDQQIDAMGAICDKAGMDKLTRNFIGTLAKNRRLYAVSSMITAFLAELSGRRGETTAVVVSAAELDGNQLKAVTDALKKSVGTSVAVQASVDKSLLGGMIVKVGSRMVDSSLKTKLQQMRLSMKGVG